MKKKLEDYKVGQKIKIDIIQVAQEDEVKVSEVPLTKEKEYVIEEIEPDCGEGLPVMVINDFGDEWYLSLDSIVHVEEEKEDLMFERIGEGELKVGDMIVVDVDKFHSRWPVDPDDIDRLQPNHRYRIRSFGAKGNMHLDNGWYIPQGMILECWRKKEEEEKIKKEEKSDMEDILQKLSGLKKEHEQYQKENDRLKQENEKLVSEGQYKDRQITELREYADDLEGQLKQKQEQEPRQYQGRVWKVGDKFTIEDSYCERYPRLYTKGKIYTVLEINDDGSPIFKDDYGLQARTSGPMNFVAEKSQDMKGIEVLQTLLEIAEDTMKEKDRGLDVYEVEISKDFKQMWDESGVPYCEKLFDKFDVVVCDVLEDEEGTPLPAKKFLVCYDEVEEENLQINIHENMTPEELNDSLVKVQKVLSTAIEQLEPSTNSKKKSTIKYSTKKDLEVDMSVWKFVFVLIGLISLLAGARYYLLGKF